MPEVTFIVDDLRGAILVEDSQDLSRDALEHLGESQEIGCARPLEMIKLPILSSKQTAESETVRIAGYYHDSLCEGPGRRSSVLFQYCSLKCKGFIYSLRWEKYYITHDRTEPTTYFN